MCAASAIRVDRARLRAAAIALLVSAWALPGAAQDVSSPAPEPPPPSASPAPADAPDRYLVAPLGGDAPEALSAEACDAVRATLAAEGFGVVDPADAATISPARFAAARRLDDLRPIATELGATAIATVAVWTSDGAASSVIVSIAPGERSFSATEAVSSSLGQSASDAVHAALGRQRDALLVGGGTTRTHDTERHDPPPAEHHDEGVIQNGQLFGIVGPGLLAALGAAGIGGGVYASLDETCDQRAPSGLCLRGERPNYALGIVFIGAGALALAGAIVWWVLGADTEEASAGPRIDVVVLPEGGGYLGARGRF